MLLLNVASYSIYNVKRILEETNEKCDSTMVNRTNDILINISMNIKIFYCYEIKL